MIVWMVWDNRDRCHYRLRWDERGWYAERYMNSEQRWANSVNVDSALLDIIKFVAGVDDNLLTELQT